MSVALVVGSVGTYMTVFGQAFSSDVGHADSSLADSIDSTGSRKRCSPAYPKMTKSQAKIRKKQTPKT